MATSAPPLRDAHAPAHTPAWTERRTWITEYFDRTASAAWARLTSDAPVSGIRRTVREGRDRMRATLAGWLPMDLNGARVLDAGCGPGTFAVELAARGATVVAVDVSPTLVALAEARAARFPCAARITWGVGDMLDAAWGRFDYVVAMDSLIHYPAAEIARALAALGARTEHGMVATFAPATPLLSTMHAVGRLFPRADRAPAIEPVGERTLRARLETDPSLGADWRWARTARVARGFYTSQAVELRRVGSEVAATPAVTAPGAVPAVGACAHREEVA
jgi:magnesium-protoporphyrin O-methyltransferase